MSECQKRGCLNLETRCKDCNRLVADRILPPQEWISVNDRFPEEGQAVLCFDSYYFVKIFTFFDGEPTFYDGDRLWTGRPLGILECVSHWMPLPEPRLFVE